MGQALVESDRGSSLLLGKASEPQNLQEVEVPLDRVFHQGLTMFLSKGSFLPFQALQFRIKGPLILK